MATVRGNTQEHLKKLLTDYLTFLNKEDIQIDEVSLTHSASEVPNLEEPYIRLEAPTGESCLCISFTDLKISAEFSYKLRGLCR